MKLTWAFLLTLAFFAWLAVIYLIHINYVPVAVVLYGAVVDVMLAALATTITMLVAGPRVSLGRFEKSLLVMLWLVGGYALAISGPTVLDRSLSFYILEKLQQRGGGILLSRIPEVFVNEYMNEFRLVDVRLTEQLESGTVTLENGCLRLTDRGSAIADFSRFFRLNLLPKQRLLNGELTDALVNPFEHSPTGKMGYEC